jgi:hypothetical protein
MIGFLTIINPLVVIPFSRSHHLAVETTFKQHENGISSSNFQGGLIWTLASGRRCAFHNLSSRIFAHGIVRKRVEQGTANHTTSNGDKSDVFHALSEKTLDNKSCLKEIERVVGVIHGSRRLE